MCSEKNIESLVSKLSNNHLKAMDVKFWELNNNMVLIISLKLFLNCKWTNSNIPYENIQMHWDLNVSLLTLYVIIWPLNSVNSICWIRLWCVTGVRWGHYGGTSHAGRMRELGWQRVTWSHCVISSITLWYSQKADACTQQALGYSSLQNCEIVVFYSLQVIQS